MLVTDHNRRTFLRGAGVCVALPALEASLLASRAESASELRRMVCIGNEFGMFPGAFWPDSTGSQYEVTPLLKPLESHRRDFTVFSHLDHDQKGGHFAVHTFLTGVKSTDARGFPEGGMSVDQRAAEHVGSQTRFPSLTIGSEDGLHGGCMMSWTRTGTRIPPIPGPRELYNALFVDDSPEARMAARDRIALRESVLDVVHDDAESLKRRVSREDQRKLDEYFDSIRDVENKLSLDRRWQDIPKPRTELDEPQNQGLTRDLPKIYELMALALQTDSTRVATLEIGGSFAASDLGIRKGYHSLSHHGQLQENLDLLIQIELYQTEQFAVFLERLKSIREPNADGTLLDRTMVLFGSGMGNANAHTNHDLPIILAGGGFRHGQHLAFPRQSNQRIPLCNLFVSMLQRFGLETDRFSMATGSLTGLESV
ncbi:MAG: DUF1552 domain-containing protein [Planctomycetaceae bacterium]|nr:DUF1552 domain-containing protein [Planctomycetaceae bacterium]